MSPRAVLALLLTLAGCRGQPSAARGAPTQEARGFSMTRSQRGAVEWRLDSARATLDETSTRAALEQPRVELFQNGRKATTARARQGELELASQDMRLAGAVVVESLAEGSRLATEELRYSAKSKEFHTDRPVEIRRPGGVMRGRGLTASHDLSVIRVRGQETRVEP
ncbi:MAG: LPS export ABC transporter periplasmic protein LptC [Elusimicrobia bacterium]|nr:LPS export ABC transporter periplasmic protein LptC [Elusimicrobiota bacterium]